MTLRGKPFQPGKDSRRHELTDAERQLGGVLGYMAAELRCSGDPFRLAWLFRKVRGDCRRRRRGKGVAVERDED